MHDFHSCFGSPSAPAGPEELAAGSPGYLGCTSRGKCFQMNVAAMLLSWSSLRPASELAHLMTLCKEGRRGLKFLMTCHRASERTGKISHLVKTCAMKELGEETLQKELRCWGKPCFESAPSRWCIPLRFSLEQIFPGSVGNHCAP